MAVATTVARAVAQACGRAVTDMPFWSSAAGVTLAFDALGFNATTYELEGVLTGTGDLTSTHASTIYSKDHEDVYREVAANGEVWTDARRVENWVSNSNDLSHADWVVSGSTVKGANNTVTFSAAWAANNIKNNINNIGDSYNNTHYIVSFKLTGTNGVDVQMRTSLGSGSTTHSETITMTGSQQHLAFAYDNDATSAGPVSFQIVNQGTASHTITLEQVQIECAASGDIPNSWITTGSITVAGVPVAVKWFANENGNSVASNVVTEGVGTALATQPFLQYQPALTNAHQYSNDMSNAYWTKVTGAICTFDQTGLTGAANTASLINFNSTSGSGINKSGQTVADDSNDHTFKVWVKKNGTVDVIRTDCRLVGGTTEVYEIGNLDLSTGVYTSANSSGTTDTDVVAEGDWWVIYVQLTNNSTGNTDRRGMGITCNSGAGSDTSGTCTVGNNEVHTNKTIAQVKGAGPIFTTSAAVSTSGTDYNFNIANLNLTEGAVYAEIYSHNDSDVLTSIQPAAISCDWAHYQLKFTLGYGDCDLALRSSSGVKPRTAVHTISGANEFKGGAAWSDSNDLAYVNYGGFVTKEDTFGSFNTGQNHISLFNVSDFQNFCCKIRNIKGYTGAYAALKAQIDTLMSA